MTTKTKLIIEVTEEDLAKSGGAKCPIQNAVERMFPDFYVSVGYDDFSLSDKKFKMPFEANRYARKYDMTFMDGFFELITFEAEEIV